MIKMRQEPYKYAPIAHKGNNGNESERENQQEREGPFTSLKEMPPPFWGTLEQECQEGKLFLRNEDQEMKKQP
jgi:hypothetical protein